MGRLSDVQLQAWVRNGHALSGKSDGDGLTFTISKHGTAAWELRYRYGGKQRWLTLGRYPDMSLKDARIRALKERVRVADGIDVVADKRRTRIALASAKTFAELCSDYMDRAVPALKQSTRRDFRRYLNKDILPSLGSYRIDEVTAADVVTLIEKIGRRSGSVARGVFSVLSIVFNHGLAKHLAKSNPCSGLRVAAIIGAKQEVREKVSLTESELCTVFANLSKIARSNALAVKILLATCTRKGELTNAKWEDVDLEQRLWTIPRENSKNAAAFVIPLAPTVVQWFLELKERRHSTEWTRQFKNSGQCGLGRAIRISRAPTL